MIFVLERVTPALRGELTRWMLEVKTGVFLGSVSADVRDRLWTQVTGKIRTGAAYLIYAAQTEQRFVVRSHGPTSREVVDHDGLTLFRSQIKGDEVV